MKHLASAVLLCLLAAAPAAAQQRPLVTEDPETVGPGLVLVEAGFDYLRDVEFPVSGLTGNRLAVPTLGVSFGISSIAEIQIDGGVQQRLSITSREDAPLASLMDFSGDTTSDFLDITLATKVRLIAEEPGRPGLALRFATELPAASNETGLGVDTINVFMTALVGKTVQSVRVVGNVGVGVMPDPVQGNRQNDVLLYGLSLARAVREGVEIVGEINGRANVRNEDVPPGTDSRAVMRVGGRFTHRTVRVDGGLLIGMTSRDPEFGITAGLTWVFHGFDVP
jgi:hypothetical protein